VPVISLTAMSAKSWSRLNPLPLPLAAYNRSLPATHSWDLQGCVVTVGSRGAFVVDRGAGAEEWGGAHEVATVDTVGAGDAFCGSLAAFLASCAELVDVVRLANAAGALSTTVNGAADSAPDRAATLALLDGAVSRVGRQSS
jgi:ribokinase